MPSFLLDDSIKPKLLEFIKKHRETEKAYRVRQSEKFSHTESVEVWNELNGKLVDLQKRRGSEKRVTTVQ